MLAFCASAPVFEALGSGQDSLLALVIWVAGLRLLLRGRDAAAGTLLALGLFKPQLFVLVPFLLLAQRRWRALGAFCAVGAGITLLSVLVQRADTWRLSLASLGSPLYTQQVQDGQAWKMQSLTALVAELVPGRLVGGVLLLAAAVGILLLGRRPGHDVQRDWALLALVTVVTSPHVVLYDLVLLLPALVWSVPTVPWRVVRGPLLAVFAAQWCIPVLLAAALRTGWASSTRRGQPSLSPYCCSAWCASPRSHCVGVRLRARHGTKGDEDRLRPGRGSGAWSGGARPRSGRPRRPGPGRR